MNYRKATAAPQNRQLTSFSVNIDKQTLYFICSWDYKTNSYIFCTNFLHIDPTNYILTRFRRTSDGAVILGLKQGF
jgi:hypothetical protein